MRARKTVEELKKSKTWASMSKEKQAERLLEETGALQCGRPARPADLAPEEVTEWNRICDGLEAKRLLAKSDSPFILAYVEAKIAGDRSLMSAISNDWLGERQPFDVALDAPASDASSADPIPNALEVARKYAEDLISGNIPAGKYAILACKRFLSDLERTDITFDPAAAQKVISYISRLGLSLIPWQIFVLSNIFGFKRGDGTRRYREAYLEVAKKNGKSTMLAGICLYMADTEQGDGEATAEVAIAATCKAQAADLVFQFTKRLLTKTPSLAERCKQYKTSIVFENSGSTIMPLASNSEKLQGRNLAAGILDELGDMADNTLYSTFDSSTVGRSQPLLLSITTAGLNRAGIAWERRNNAIQILEGMPGDSFFSFICAVDENDDVLNDEACWIKANPSLGTLLKIDSLREKFNNAKTVLSHKYSVLRYHANVWPTTSLSPWVDFNVLDEQGNAYRTPEEKLLPVPARIAAALVERSTKKNIDLTKVSNAELAALRRAEVANRPFGGGDFATKRDLSCLCWLYPPMTPTGTYQAFFKVWIPHENIVQRTKEDKVPYSAWADHGYVTVTNGSTTDFEVVQRDILALHEQFNFKEVGADISGVPDMLQRLEKSGLKITSVRQGFALSGAIRRTEKLLEEKRFLHFGNPIFCWCARNVSLRIGSIKGDAQLEKEKSRERIDAATAAVLAVHIEMSQIQQPVAVDPNAFKVRTIPIR